MRRVCSAAIESTDALRIHEPGQNATFDTLKGAAGEELRCQSRRYVLVGIGAFFTTQIIEAPLATGPGERLQLMFPETGWAPTDWHWTS